MTVAVQPLYLCFAILSSTYIDQALLGTDCASKFIRVVVRRGVVIAL